MTAASITQPHSRAGVGISPLARVAVAVVGLAAAMVLTAAMVVLLSALVSFPVAVSVDGEVVGRASNPWWWIDAIGAFLSGAVAIAAVVETIRIVRSPGP